MRARNDLSYGLALQERLPLPVRPTAVDLTLGGQKGQPFADTEEVLRRRDNGQPLDRIAEDPGFSRRAVRGPEERRPAEACRSIVDDGVPMEALSVALGRGTTWLHGLLGCHDLQPETRPVQTIFRRTRREVLEWPHARCALPLSVARATSTPGTTLGVRSMARLGGVMLTTLKRHELSLVEQLPAPELVTAYCMVSAC